jgi:hypothetical protein
MCAMMDVCLCVCDIVWMSLSMKRSGPSGKLSFHHATCVYMRHRMLYLASCCRCRRCSTKSLLADSEDKGEQRQAREATDTNAGALQYAYGLRHVLE